MQNPDIKDINKLENILRQHVNKAAVDQALQDYKKWTTNLKEDKKEIVHLLYLLKAAEERSGNSELKNNRRISELILAKADIPNPDRRHSTEKSYLTLLQKEIGKKYQIEIEFSDSKGSKIKKSLQELNM